MIKDIHIPEVKNVTLAIAQEKSPGDTPAWKVFLINNNDFRAFILSFRASL